VKNAAAALLLIGVAAFGLGWWIPNLLVGR
jgi:hypothetical protein